MNIIDYIIEVGAETAAKEFGVAVVTARSWRYGVRKPCLRLAREIAKKKGWTLDQVYALNCKPTPPPKPRPEPAQPPAEAP